VIRRGQRKNPKNHRKEFEGENRIERHKNRDALLDLLELQVIEDGSSGPGERGGQKKQEEKES